MSIDDYSQEELDALEEQTDRICESLKYIENHDVYQGEDLEQLGKRLEQICLQLRYIEENLHLLPEEQ